MILLSIPCRRVFTDALSVVFLFDAFGFLLLPILFWRSAGSTEVDPDYAFGDQPPSTSLHHTAWKLHPFTSLETSARRLVVVEAPVLVIDDDQIERNSTKWARPTLPFKGSRLSYVIFTFETTLESIFNDIVGDVRATFLIQYDHADTSTQIFLHPVHHGSFVYGSYPFAGLPHFGHGGFTSPCFFGIEERISE